MQVIAELDEKKREALEKTWLKVNQDFGSIFCTLLPGTSAKLEPQEGQSFLNGGSPSSSLDSLRKGFGLPGRPSRAESAKSSACSQAWRSRWRLETFGRSR